MASALMVPQATRGGSWGIGTVQGRNERLQTPLLHDGRARLPNCRTSSTGFALRLDLAYEVVKIACRVMGCLLDNMGVAALPEGKAPTLKQLLDETLPCLALWIEDQDLQGGTIFRAGSSSSGREVMRAEHFAAQAGTPIILMMLPAEWAACFVRSRSDAHCQRRCAPHPPGSRLAVRRSVPAHPLKERVRLGKPDPRSPVTSMTMRLTQPRTLPSGTSSRPHWGQGPAPQNAVSRLSRRWKISAGWPWSLHSQ